MTNYHERLDKILNSGDGVLHCCGDYQEEAKQAILRWVADEFDINETIDTLGKVISSPDNPLGMIMLKLEKEKFENILAQHGYKGVDQ